MLLRIDKYLFGISKYQIETKNIYLHVLKITGLKEIS